MRVSLSDKKRGISSGYVKASNKIRKNVGKFGKMWENCKQKIELNGSGWEIPEGNWDSNGKNGGKIIELNGSYGSEMVALPF